MKLANLFLALVWLALVATGCSDVNSGGNAPSDTAAHPAGWESPPLIVRKSRVCRKAGRVWLRPVARN